jgi:multiple sugar transport system permease protein
MSVASARSEVVMGEVSPLWRIIQRVIPIVGWTVIIIFALIQILPFLFTLSNSAKCLPAIQTHPEALIPIPPFDIDCQVAVVDESGETRLSNRTDTASGLTFKPSLEGYREVFEQNLARWLFNTFFVAACVTILHLIFDSLAGYALARIEFPGSRLIFYIVLSTMMIPGIVLLLPRFIIMKEIGLINNYPSLIVPFAASLFGVFLMKQFFESVPREIEEAAMVDGANRFIIFARIVLPMSTPALTALAIFSFQGMWNEFLQVLLLVAPKEDLWTLPLGLSFLRGEFGESLRWHTFLAGSVITTLPLAVVFFTFQRYFVEGISYTGLKG